MKNLLRILRTKIQKFLLINILLEDTKRIHRKQAEIDRNLDNRRTEIDGLIESLQNLDNNEVIRDSHLRIESIESLSETIGINNETLKQGDKLVWDGDKWTNKQIIF